MALFHLSGGVAAQDLKEGATRLRVAADGGYLPAKVYLANLYELGVHFAADPVKADVWYRSAARAAGITADAESAEYAKAMAELGCARYCLALAEDKTTPEAEQERLLKKAKAYGYQLALRRDSRASATPPEPATPAASEEPRKETPAPEAATKKKEEKPASSARDATVRTRLEPTAGASMAAFFYAALFLAGSIAAAYFLTIGANELLQRGASIPLLAKYPRALFPIVVVLFGVLPAFLMYKAITVLRAAGVAVLLGGAGYALWGAPYATLFADKEVQALLVGAAGFLGALLVSGSSEGSSRSAGRRRGFSRRRRRRAEHPTIGQWLHDVQCPRSCTSVTRAAASPRSETVPDGTQLTSPQSTQTRCG